MCSHPALVAFRQRPDRALVTAASVKARRARLRHWSGLRLFVLLRFDAAAGQCGSTKRRRQVARSPDVPPEGVAELASAALAQPAHLAHQPRWPAEAGATERGLQLVAALL